MTILNGNRQDLGEYMRVLADLMGLRDWTVNVLPTPCDTEYAAQVEVRYGRKFANVQFADDWANVSPESLRATCVHELLHCHLKPTEWALNNVQFTLGSLAFGVLEGAYTDALEVAVDAIASEWAKTLPLPVKEDEE